MISPDVHFTQFYTVDQPPPGSIDYTVANISVTAVLTTLLSLYFVPAAFLLMSSYKPFEQTKGEEKLKAQEKTA